MKYLVLLAVAGCALTSKAEPLDIRYFSPERSHGEAAPASAVPRARVRLGRITSSAHLRYHIVHRESAVEVEPYEALRWTEQPELYVRRALAHALFETEPLEQAVGGTAPTLDVELVAFEEVRHGSARAGRVELRFELHDEHHVLARGSAIAERPAPGATIEQVVPAIGAAMETSTGTVAERVAAVLCPGP
jgi:cholesterol transport system auxiliary component